MSTKSIEEAIDSVCNEIARYAAERLKEALRAWGRLPDEEKVRIEAGRKLDPAELENLPWTKWLKDEKGNRVRAKPGEPGWVKNPLYFKDLEAPTLQVELANALTKAGGKLELGGYVFSFGGKENRFINRRPVKKEGASSSTGIDENDAKQKPSLPQ